MRFLGRSLTALFLLAVTVGLLALAAHTVMEAVADRRAAPVAVRPAQERVFAVQVVEVAPGTLAPELAAFGEIRALRRLELRAPAAGRVAELAPGIKDGAAVAAGALILRLDPAEAEAARALAEADLAQAEAELADATAALSLAAEDLAVAEEQAALRARALDRQRDLAGRGVGAAAATEEAELALSSARAAVVSRRQALAQAEARRALAETALARARVTLSEAERRLSDTVLRAAFDGRLAELEVVEGGLVATNERLGLLIDPAALEVRFRVSAAQFARLIDAAGRLQPLPVAVTLDVMGAEIVAEGVLERAGAAVGEGQSGRELHARLGTARGFLPGDFVSVRVTEPALDGVARLPATAVDAAGRVLVVGEGDRLREAQVEVLRREGDTVLVAAGALAGAEVVAARSPTLGAGIRIRPVRPLGEPDAAEAAGTVMLSAERRAALIALVAASEGMPEAAKARLIAQLEAEEVPAALVSRLETRLGG